MRAKIINFERGGNDPLNTMGIGSNSDNYIIKKLSGVLSFLNFNIYDAKAVNIYNLEIDRYISNRNNIICAWDNPEYTIIFYRGKDIKKIIVFSDIDNKDHRYVNFDNVYDLDFWKNLLRYN